MSAAIDAWFDQNQSTIGIEDVLPIFKKWCDEQHVDLPALEWVPSGFGYDRCLLERKYPYYDIYAIRWPPGARAPIHDHAQRGCVQVVVSGTLEERRCLRRSKAGNSFTFTGANLIKTGTATFIKGFHSIRNPTLCSAFSVHLYAPCEHSTMYFQPPCSLKLRDFLMCRTNEGVRALLDEDHKCRVCKLYAAEH